MNRSAVVSPKIVSRPEDVSRNVKETRALIRAANNAVRDHAKKTRTVFIGRDGSVRVRDAE